MLTIRNTRTSPANVIGTLNRLLRILCRSLPMYLEDAHPWTDGESQPAQTALARLTADQRFFCRRIAQAISERGGQPEPGHFPMAFTGLNDVTFDYLLGQVVDKLRCDLSAIERCVADLASTPDARTLAEEVLGNMQGHWDILKGLKDEG
jgi:hypothetical protein